MTHADELTATGDGPLHGAIASQTVANSEGNEPRSRGPAPRRLPRDSSAAPLANFKPDGLPDMIVQDLAAELAPTASRRSSTTVPQLHSWGSTGARRRWRRAFSFGICTIATLTPLAPAGCDSYQ